MNAAVFYGPNNIKIKDIDIQKRKSNEILLKVLSCSVCSYDVRTFRNGHFKVTPPIILGHEICAQIIDEYQSKNLLIKPKSRVSIYPIIPCNACWYCAHKKYNLCINLKEIGSTLNGGFAEYILVPKTVFEIGGIIPVLDNVSNEEACLIEPLACCINGINQVKNLEINTVIIIGDGPIGLMQLLLIKKILNKNVTIIGKIPHRLESAKKLGADYTLLINEKNNDNDNDNNNNIFEKYKKLIKNTSSEFSPNLIFISNNKNQNVNNKVMINIDPNFIHYNQISIFGSFSSTPKAINDAMNLINSKEIDLKEIITKKFSLFEIEEALQATESFKGFKSIINN